MHSKDKNSISETGTIFLFMNFKRYTRNFSVVSSYIRNKNTFYIWKKKFWVSKFKHFFRIVWVTGNTGTFAWLYVIPKPLQEKKKINLLFLNMVKCDISQVASTTKCKSNKTKTLECNMFFFHEIRVTL